MKNTMTRAMALTTALTFVPSEQTEVREILTKMVAQVSKSHTSSDEKKAERKAKTASARAELVAKVAPILRKHLTSDVTAKELYEIAKDELPDGFSAAKVQNILLREMKSELVRSENGRNASTYHLI